MKPGEVVMSAEDAAPLVRADAANCEWYRRVRSQYESEMRREQGHERRYGRGSR